MKRLSLVSLTAVSDYCSTLLLETRADCRIAYHTGYIVSLSFVYRFPSNQYSTQCSSVRNIYKHSSKNFWSMERRYNRAGFDCTRPDELSDTMIPFPFLFLLFDTVTPAIPWNDARRIPFRSEPVTAISGSSQSRYSICEVNTFISVAVVTRYWTKSANARDNWRFGIARTNP